MKTIILQPDYNMTAAECAKECETYLINIANQEYNGEDWQTEPKNRRRDLITDLLCDEIGITGTEFIELCELIGFHVTDKTRKAAENIYISISGRDESEFNYFGGLTIQQNARIFSKTKEQIRRECVAFWHCLVNKLRYLCLGIGAVVEPIEIAA